MQQFLALGQEDSGAKEEALAERRAALNGDSILTIIYTSGTTGRPKGVVLTHSNMLYEGEVIAKLDVARRSDLQLFFLPLAHVFAKVLEVAWFTVGYSMAFAENMTTIKENLGEVRPTLMCGVPRVFEKFHAAVVEKGGSAGGIKGALFAEALTLSQKNGEAEERGETLGLVDSLKFAALKKIIFSKIGEGIQTILGGRMRLMVSGGAPLAKKIGWFFRDAGLTVIEGYGLTETSAATCLNDPHANKIGTVGPALPGTDLRFADDGEIMVRGPGVMREYWKNPEATTETFSGDWLCTGDIGELDPRSKSLRITDRKKDIIVTAGGKNVAPQKIENLLKTHKLISQAVVHGDRRKFLTALITVDEAVVGEWAKRKGVQGSYAELSQRSDLRQEVESLIESSNSELASYESVKKFHILDRDFSIEDGELTPKLSVKRKVVSSRYGQIFDEFYTEKY